MPAQSSLSNLLQGLGTGAAPIAPVATATGGAAPAAGVALANQPAGGADLLTPQLVGPDSPLTPIAEQGFDTLAPATPQADTPLVASSPIDPVLATLPTNVQANPGFVGVPGDRVKRLLEMQSVDLQNARNELANGPVNPLDTTGRDPIRFQQAFKQAQLRGEDPTAAAAQINAVIGAAPTRVELLEARYANGGDPQYLQQIAQSGFWTQPAETLPGVPTVNPAQHVGIGDTSTTIGQGGQQELANFFRMIFGIQ